MSGHYDDKTLLDFVQKQVSVDQIRAIEDHLGDCSFCYDHYLDVLKFVHERLEKPDETFVTGIMEKLQSTGVARPTRTIRASQFGAEIQFFDSENKRITELKAHQVRFHLHDEQASGAIEVSLDDFSIKFAVVRQNNAHYRISVSTEGGSSDLSVTCYLGGSGLETICLDREGIFQTMMRPSEYFFSVRQGENPIGNIRLELQ